MTDRILIPGGTGLVGRALASHLAREGREIVLLSRATETRRPAPDLPPGCRIARWDGRSSAGWLELAEGASAIVNLAGESISGGRWTRERKRRIRDSRLQATGAVVEAISQSRKPVRTLVQASAVGYYGDRGEEVLTESSSPGTGFLAETARAWEAASAPVEKFGVRRALARTALVLSRQGGALPAMALPTRFGLGAVLGSGRQWMPWIHLADEVAALAFLIENPGASGAFNLAAPETVTQAQFSRRLAQALHRPMFFRAPAWAVRAALGEMSELVLASQQVNAGRLGELGFRFEFPEVTGALADLMEERPERKS
ncbi:MAG: TIGR01777 family oxidoreductase [Thermoanaerobaculia bacterium]